MDKYSYKLENTKDESYLLIEIDIAQRNAKLNIYRVGYRPGDKKETPLKSFSISSALNEIGQL